jgi:NO-binding membrane sensor protein with MHYT domain
VAFKFAWLAGAALCVGHSIWVSTLAVLLAASADLLWVYGFYTSRSAAALR